jgi:hypothetical protein
LIAAPPMPTTRSRAYPRRAGRCARAAVTASEASVAALDRAVEIVPGSAAGAQSRALRIEPRDRLAGIRRRKWNARIADVARDASPSGRPRIVVERIRKPSSPSGASAPLQPSAAMSGELDGAPATSAPFARTSSAIGTSPASRPRRPRRSSSDTTRPVGERSCTTMAATEVR